MEAAVWSVVKTMNPSFLPGTPRSEAQTPRDYLLTLLCELAYQEGEFTLSSGQSSSYYINCKPVTLHPYGALVMGQLMLPMLTTGTQGVAGLTLGADPMVSAVGVVSAIAEKPVFSLIIRKEAKGHGTQAYIEGPVVAGAKVAVLEDVVTTGQSALTAVQRLRDAGYQVDQVIALVDRQQGGAELYAQEGLDFKTIFQIPDLKEKYQQLQ
jgi:orotate phosphoribosyltransferase